MSANVPATKRLPGMWQLAYPIIIGNVMFALAAMIQTKFVGVLGPQAVAAVGVSQRVFFALQALFMAISVGATALIARAWGAGDRREAAHVLISAMVMTLVVSALLMLVGLLFAPAIAAIFGLDAATTVESTRNIRWLSAFVIGLASNIVLAGALRAAADVWVPLVFVTGANLLSVALFYVFIFGAFGMPRMESAGAPFAAGLAYTLAGLVLAFAWTRQKLTIAFDLSEWLQPDRYRRLTRIAYPSALEQMVLQSGMFGFLALIGHFYGKEAFAAYAVGINLLNLAIVVGFAFSIAGSTLVGQHLGAGDFKAARRSGWRALAFAAASMSLIALITAIYAEELARFFLGDQEITVRYTVQFTYIMSSVLPLLGVEFAIGGALRGAGDTRFPLMTTFLGLALARVGLASVLIHMGLSVVWVYGTMAVEYILKATLLIWRFRSGKWQHAVPGRFGSG